MITDLNIAQTVGRAMIEHYLHADRHAPVDWYELLDTPCYREA